MYIKLDGENIMSHIDERHPGIDAKDWDAKVDEHLLVNDSGKYKYKYSKGKLVELTAQEYANHPLNVAAKEEEFKDKVRKLLQESDYTQIQDVPISDEDRIKWKNYRVELRNLKVGDELPAPPNYIFDADGNLVEIVPKSWWAFWK